MSTDVRSAQGNATFDTIKPSQLTSNAAAIVTHTPPEPPKKEDPTSVALRQAISDPNGAAAANQNNPVNASAAKTHFHKSDRNRHYSREEHEAKRGKDLPSLLKGGNSAAFTALSKVAAEPQDKTATIRQNSRGVTGTAHEHAKGQAILHFGSSYQKTKTLDDKRYPLEAHKGKTEKESFFSEVLDLIG